MTNIGETIVTQRDMNRHLVAMGESQSGRKLTFWKAKRNERNRFLIVVSETHATSVLSSHKQ